jgi:hypothetical protein
MLRNAPAPAGGNFVALDGDQTTTSSQADFVGNQITGSIKITGLTPGQTTTVSFFWAAAQGGGGSTMGATNDQLTVSLCTADLTELR